MSLLFSRRCDYAMQAVLYVAQRDGAMTKIQELTESLGIPYHFVAKILQDLSRKGLLKSRKGPRGGFILRTAAEEVTLFDIIAAIDGDRLQNTCVLGFHECSAGNPCAAHEKWMGIREGVKEMFVGMSIAQAAREIRKPGYAPDRAMK